MRKIVGNKEIGIKREKNNKKYMKKVGKHRKKTWIDDDKLINYGKDMRNKMEEKDVKNQ